MNGTSNIADENHVMGKEGFNALDLTNLIHTLRGEFLKLYTIFENYIFKRIILMVVKEIWTFLYFISCCFYQMVKRRIAFILVIQIL